MDAAQGYMRLPLRGTAAPFYPNLKSAFKIWVKGGCPGTYIIHGLLVGLHMGTALVYASSHNDYVNNVFVSIQRGIYISLAPFCHFVHYFHIYKYSISPFLPFQQTLLKCAVHSSPLFSISADFLEICCTTLAPFCHSSRLS